MGPRDNLDLAVDEVRDFNRMYTRLIGVLDYPGQLNTPYTLSEVSASSTSWRGGSAPMSRRCGSTWGSPPRI